MRLLSKSFGFQQLAFNISKICFVLMEIGNGILVANRKSFLNIVLNLIWIYILQKYFRTVHSLQKQEMSAKSMQLHWNCITWLHLCQKQLFSFFYQVLFFSLKSFQKDFFATKKINLAWYRRYTFIIYEFHLIKDCVHFIFGGLFFNPKKEYLWTVTKCFLFHFKSSFRSWENHILISQIFKFHDVIKCLSMKQEMHLQNNLRSKYSMLMKIGQFMSYYKRKKIIKKFYKNCDAKTSFSPIFVCKELKSSSHFPKKIALFASSKALSKWRKMLFILS